MLQPQLQLLQKWGKDDWSPCFCIPTTYTVPIIPTIVSSACQPLLNSFHSPDDYLGKKGPIFYWYYHLDNVILIILSWQSWINILLTILSWYCYLGKKGSIFYWRLQRIGEASSFSCTLLMHFSYTTICEHNHLWQNWSSANKKWNHYILTKELLSLQWFPLHYRCILIYKYKYKYKNKYT